MLLSLKLLIKIYMNRYIKTGLFGHTEESLIYDCRTLSSKDIIDFIEVPFFLSLIH